MLLFLIPSVISKNNSPIFLDSWQPEQTATSATAPIEPSALWRDPGDMETDGSGQQKFDI